MAVNNKIALNATSDVELTNWRLNTTNASWLDIVSGTTPTSLSGLISANMNMIESDRYATISVSAKYGDREISSRLFKIEQDRHPDYYLSGETRIMKAVSGTPSTSVKLGEDGGSVVVTTYASKESDPTKILTTPDYFSLDVVSGTCVYTITKAKYVQNNTLRWDINITRNTEIINKDLILRVTFDNGLDSTWSDIVTINQSRHIQVIRKPILSATPTIIGPNGGDVRITHYYMVDDVKVSLSGLKIDNTTISGFTASEITLVSGNTTSVLHISKNNSDETPNGSVNKRVRLSALNPLNPRAPLYTEFIYQQTKKQSVYIFNFDDGSLEKNIASTPYEKEGGNITFNIISTKDGEEVDVELVSPTPSFVTFISFSSTLLTLNLAENTTTEVRSGTIVIKQKNSTMPSIKVSISQYGKDTYVMANFDYMICNIGSDTISGYDLDVIMYAPEMPRELEMYKCVGYGSANWLYEHDLADSAYTDLEDGGDVENYIFAMAPDSREGKTMESCIFKPKQMLSESFIKSQVEAGKTHFDIEFYNNFFTEIHSGIITIAFEAYIDEEDGVTIIDSGEIFGQRFVPGDGADMIKREVYNAKTYKSNQLHNDIDFKNKYSKIGTLRYSYSTGVWTFIQNDESKITHKSSEVIKANNFHKVMKQIGTTEYYGTELFGNFKEDTTDVNFVTLGSTGYVYFDASPTTHTFNNFELYYDQTQHVITGIAIEHKDLSSEEISWKTYEDGYNLKWQVDNSDSDFCFWIRYINLEGESPTVKFVTRDVANVKLSNGLLNAIPTGVITGTLKDIQTGINATYTISSGTTAYRKITWRDTDNGNTSATKAVKFLTMSGVPNTSKLNGFDTYNTRPLSVYFDNAVAMSNFNYRYNGSSQNLVLVWGKKSTSYTKDITVYAGEYSSGQDKQYKVSIYTAVNSSTELPKDSDEWELALETDIISITSLQEYIGNVTFNSSSLSYYTHIKAEFTPKDTLPAPPLVFVSSQEINSTNDSVLINLTTRIITWFVK